MAQRLATFTKRIFHFLMPPAQVDLQPPAGLNLTLIQDRERILTALFRTIAILGLFTLILIIPAVLRERLFGLLTIYTLLLGLSWVAAIHRQIDYRLRAGLLLAIEYGVGVIDLVNFGLAEDGRVYLFAFSVMGIILLGPWVGMGALGLSLATLAGIGWLMSTGRLVQFQPVNIPAEALTLETVIITCMVFLMQVGTVMAALQVLLRALELAWQREQAAVNLLEQERDLLEQRVAERTRELAQARDQALAASQAKTQLLAKVSHELRTPLSVILGYAEMLQKKFYGPLSAEQQEPVENIIGSSLYLTRHVNDLLDQAKLDAGKLELYPNVFILADLVQNVHTQMELLARAKKLTLSTQIAADMPATLYHDRNRLQQILFNLISNAVKFTESGGISVLISRSGETFWTIRVSDTGPGISAEAQRYIFEPFQQIDDTMTRKHEGIGLGLSIVKQLVTLMRGEITLESKPGQGSTFTILLPLNLIQEEDASLL